MICVSDGSPVANQADVEKLFAGCDTIQGDINVFNNYTGSLNLPGVVTINGSLTVYIPLDSGIHNTMPNLTSIQLNDLTTLTVLNLECALTKIQIPVLTNAAQVSISSYLPLNLSLPSLANSRWISMYGNFSKLHMPRLTTLNSLSISTYAKRQQRIEPRGFALDIDLPALTVCDIMLLAGNVLSISLPSLVATSGLISVDNRLIDISFSSLSNISAGLYSFGLDSGLQVQGRISNLEFPVLKGMPNVSYLSVNIDRKDKSQSHISLPLLSDVSNLKIQGPIQSLDLPSLSTVMDSLTVESSLQLDCRPIAAAWARSTKFNTTTFWGTKDRYTCQGAGPRFSTGAIVGMTFGIAIGTAILFWCVWCKVENRKDMKKKAAELRARIGTGIELNNRRSAGAVPG